MSTYVPTGGYKSDNSNDTPSTRVLAAWRHNADVAYLGELLIIKELTTR